MTEAGEMDGAEWRPQIADPESFEAIDALVVGQVMVMTSGVVVAYAMGKRLGSWRTLTSARGAVIRYVLENLK